MKKIVDAAGVILFALVFSLGLVGLSRWGDSRLVTQVEAQVSNPTYPPGAIAVIDSTSTADTASQTATLPASPSRLTHICGWTVTGLGATALSNVVVTVATLQGNKTLNYAYAMPVGATVIAAPVGDNYTPCLPANAVNTAVVVTVPGAAGNTNTNIAVWGYQQLQ